MRIKGQTLRWQLHKTSLFMTGLSKKAGLYGFFRKKRRLNIHHFLSGCSNHKNIMLKWKHRNPGARFECLNTVVRYYLIEPKSR